MKHLSHTSLSATATGGEGLRDVEQAAANVFGAPEQRRWMDGVRTSRTWSTSAPALSIGGGVDVQVFGELRCENARRVSDALSVVTTAAEAAEVLVRRTWGAYVAFIHDSDGLFAFRDPSGAIPLYLARNRDLQIASTHLTPAFLKAAGVGWEIDTHIVAKLLGSPPAPAYLSGLEGIEIATPGELVGLAPAGRRRKIWCPVDIASRNTVVAPNVLAATLDCVLGHLAGNGRIGVELSGGIDSSIVCSSLGHLGASPKPFNFATSGKGGDEAHFAADVARKWDAHLHRFSSGGDYPDYRGFEGFEHGVQPSLHGLDSLFARARQQLVDCEDVDMVMTGQGGDSLFFNIPTRLIAADRRLDLGTHSVFAASTVGDARRVRGSVWSVIAAAFGRRTVEDQGDRQWLTPHLLGPAAAAALGEPLPEHPWLDDRGRLPPAKAMHLTVLAHCQIYYGGRLFPSSVPVIHPLLTQPMLELALACPTYELQFGSRDRGLARKAFGARLPQSVLSRRNKGEASDHYARAILKNRDWLLDFLLDGELVQAGLLKRDALEQAMTPDAIHLGTDYRAFVQYASVESWMRYWS
jgi:asparagine synthase (glutamine-hydrolysing)